MFAEVCQCLRDARLQRRLREALAELTTDPLPPGSEKFAGLDDLPIEFGETPEGSAFVDAWFNARKVVDLVRAAKPAAAQSPEPAPK